MYLLSGAGVSSQFVFTPCVLGIGNSDMPIG